MNSIKALNTKDELNISISPFIIYLLITILIYILPSMKIQIPYLISGSLMLLTVVIFLFKTHNLDDYIFFILLSSFVLMIINWITGAYSFVESINQAIRNIRFFIPCLWTVYCIKYCSLKKGKVLLIIFLCVYFMILTKTLDALNSDQWITRILAKSSTEDTPEIRAYRLQNIGGFEFSYMTGIIALLFFYGAISFEKIWSKILSLSLFASCFYFIIKTMYTTLLILTSIGILLMVLFKSKSHIFRLFTVLIFGVLFFTLPQILLILSEYFDGSLLSTKFLQIHDTLTGQGLDSLGSRPEKILSAISLWSQHPIFGSNSTEANAHSLFFETLASSGLAGCSVMVITFIWTYKIIVKEIIGIGIDPMLTRISFVFIGLLSFFNPIGYCFELPIAAFFVAPIFSYLTTIARKV